VPGLFIEYDKPMGKEGMDDMVAKQDQIGDTRLFDAGHCLAKNDPEPTGWERKRK